jgi:sugar phosphate isomerase/epimerase
MTDGNRRSDAPVSGKPFVRLGINNGFAAKRWPRAEDWAAVVRNDLGLDLVELSADLIEGAEALDERRRTVERTRAALAEQGLTAETTFTGLAAFGLNMLMHPDPERRAAAVAWYRDLVDLTVELGAVATGGHVGTMSVPDWSAPDRRKARWADLRDGMAQVAAHARTAGLDYLMLENLPALREPSTIARVEDLLTGGDADHVPWLLCFDVGHTCVPGTTGDDRDPYAWLRRFAGRLGEVQLQQSDGLGDHHWQFSAERNRTGIVEAGRLLDTLAESGLSNLRLVLEIIPPGEQADDDVLAELKQSVAYWRTAIDARGLLQPPRA